MQLIAATGDLTREEQEVLQDFRTIKAHGFGDLLVKVHEGTVADSSITLRRKFKDKHGNKK